MTEKRVFISYAPEDRGFAELVYELLEKRDIGCFIPPIDVNCEKEEWSEITKAIEQSRVCVFLFSANSNASREARLEIQIASIYGLTIIPVCLEPVEMNDFLMYYLSDVQWIPEYNEGLLFSRVSWTLLYSEK